VTFQELAKIADSRDYPREAALAYEIAIQKYEASLDTILDLAVLYFVCTDFGYSAHHHLLPEFSAKAYERALEILDIAEDRWGQKVEIVFWRQYFRYVVLGDDPFVEMCEQLARSSSSLIPYFYLFTSIEGEKYRPQAQQLFELVKDGTTAKKRYIRSILESRVNTNETVKPTLLQ